MKQLVLVRHGQSTWNLENRFTGWVDVDLSDKGVDEAKNAGKTLAEHGFKFDVAMTSVLKRSVRTLWFILEGMDQMYIPVNTDWRINERHYGSLQGLNKKETSEKYGDDMVLNWRRGFSVRPPAMDIGDPSHPSHDEKYANINGLPDSESLADTLARVKEWWFDILQPELKENRKAIVVAHGNSLRALIKYLDNINDGDIVSYNIPTGIPLVYEFNNDMSVSCSKYLGDQKSLESAMNAVKNQASSK